MKGNIVPKYAAHAGMVLLMAVANIFAVMLIEPMQNAGLFAFENPDSLGNIIFFLILMMVFTVILLILIKKKVRWIISAIIAFSLAMVIFYVVLALTLPFIPEAAAYAIGILAAVCVILLLKFYPEWYIIDAVGLVTSAGCAAIFGISLSPLPVIVLLVLLIIYDYVAVHRTKHMLTLADGVMQQKMPIMFLVPKSRRYSYRRAGLSIQGEEERSAYMIGLGDMIMPGILIVSAQVYASGIAFFGVTLPAIGALLGAMVGLCLLAIPMRSGKPQPGLPLINSCTILGFIVCCVIAGSWEWLSVGFW